MTGPDIAALRKRLGLQQAEMARVLMINPSTLYRYERGDIATIAVETLWRIDTMRAYAGVLAERMAVK